MKFLKARLVAAVAAASIALFVPTATAEQSPAQPVVAAASAYGPQYNTVHVYVEHGKLDAFVRSWEATFGGTHNPPAESEITPTPSKEAGTIIKSPVGLVSAYDYQSAIPFPFGQEKMGWAVHGVDAAVSTGHHVGVTAPVAPWTGPVSREGVARFPGGFAVTLYEQFDMSGFTPLKTEPETRIYLSNDTVGSFLRSYLKFTGGKVTSDVRNADGGEIGAPGTTYHRIRLTSPFGDKAKASGATVLSGPHAGDGRTSAMVEFPGGYVAEVHENASA